MQPSSKKAYRHRFAYGAWINDLRNEPLPLEGWPAPQLDDECIDSIIRSLDVQSEAGFSQLALWGLFSTYGYPPDIVSVLNKDRRRRLQRLFRAARERGMKIMFGMGVMTWGYDAIMAADESVRGVATGPDGKLVPSVHAMCGANEKSWGYVNKILDFALSEFDFGGVHLESADQGWCACPECAGKDGVVGYNVRLNIRCADYIKSKWPDKVVTSTDINWTPSFFTREEMDHCVRLSSHIDCFMDQCVYLVNRKDRRDFIKRLQCPYALTGGINFYPSVRLDRHSYFLPYARTAATQIKREYEEGVRGALVYEGPINNPGTEVSVAVVGRMLCDVDRDVEATIAEVIKRYYKPRNERAHKKLVELFLKAEDAYFDQFEGRVQRFRERFNIDPKYVDGVEDLDRFFMLDDLFATSPGPAEWLREPTLDAKGRQEYKKGLISILRDLPSIEGQFDDTGRIANIKRAIIITLTLINTIG